MNPKESPSVPKMIQTILRDSGGSWQTWTQNDSSHPGRNPERDPLRMIQKKESLRVPKMIQQAQKNPAGSWKNLDQKWLQPSQKKSQKILQVFQEHPQKESLRVPKMIQAILRDPRKLGPKMTLQPSRKKC